MKSIIGKYKWRILFWLIFLVIILYLAPKQGDYYLEDDIEYFKKQYLIPSLIWIGASISVIFLFILFINTKSIKQSFLSFLYVSLITAFFLFIFQDLFLAGSLFINRQFKRGSLQKAYVINYMAGVEKTKHSFIPYDISIRQISNDRKLINKLYQPELKQNDTVSLKFDKGLFGIEFQSQPLYDK